MASVFMLLLLMLSAGVQAQGPASSPAPSTDCLTALTGLSDCLTYVEKGSNLTVPDKGCCPGLSSLVDSAPLCLCQLLGSGETYGLQIDRAKALKLPAACHVDTPSVSLCSLVGIPVGSPMSSTPAPMSGGPLPSSGGVLTPGSTPTLAPSSNRGSSSFRAFDIVLLVGLSCAGISLAIF